jgi:hypothetical protein
MPQMKGYKKNEILIEKFHIPFGDTTWENLAAVTTQ